MCSMIWFEINQQEFLKCVFVKNLRFGYMLTSFGKSFTFNGSRYILFIRVNF